MKRKTKHRLTKAQRAAKDWRAFVRECDAAIQKRRKLRAQIKGLDQQIRRLRSGR